MSTYTVHGVLAGAYAGKNPKLAHTLTHGSTDRGHTALCNRVKADSLCDVHGTPKGEPLTCPVCVRKVKKLGLVRIEVEAD